MKKFFTIAAAFLPLCSLIAQTYLNQPFGSSKSQVLEFLKSRNLSRTSVADDSSVTTSTESYTVSYHFDVGGLYKLETQTDFPAGKDAVKALDGFRDQFQRENAVVMELNNEKELTRFAALSGRELHEVSAVSLGKNGTQLRIMALDLDRSPNEAVAGLRHDNMLFAMIHK